MEVKKIYPALGKVMNECGSIGKNQKNITQGFKFRGIDDVMNELHGSMARNGVICLTECHYESMTREVKVTDKGKELTYTLLPVTFHLTSTEDGSEVVITTIGEGMDSGDKGINKAESIALKYAMLQAFMIPTEDMADPDREAYEAVGTKETKKVRKLSPDGKEVPEEVIKAFYREVNGMKLGKIWASDHDFFMSLATNDPDPEIKKDCEVIMRYKGELK